tara:strand:- start:1723 stop:2220 length:498 start_codon:yes stop_codon:yes gene_type:complete
MKILLLTVGSLALLSACSGGSGSLGGGSSAGGGSAQSIGSGGSSSFGSRRSEKDDTTVTKPADTRAYVSMLTSARTEASKGGKILRVVGSVDRVGYYNMELVLVDDASNSVITYQARAAAPSIGRAAITLRQSTVTLGAFIPTTFKPSARTIVVQGLKNTLRVSR